MAINKFVSGPRGNEIQEADPKLSFPSPGAEDRFLADLYRQFYKYTPSGYNDEYVDEDKEILCEVDSVSVEQADSLKLTELMNEETHCDCFWDHV